MKSFDCSGLKLISQFTVLHLGSNSHPISWDTTLTRVNESQFGGQSRSTTVIRGSNIHGLCLSAVILQYVFSLAV
jgi:hypothetical protein